LGFNFIIKTALPEYGLFFHKKNRNSVNSYACGNYLVKVRASETEKDSIVEDGLEFEGAMGQVGYLPLR
jgi:hypothetical protein